MFDDNFFEFQPNYILGWIIIGAISIQLIVLSLQKVLGIKFFVPKFLRKHLYNYERMIKENDQAAEQLVVSALSVGGLFSLPDAGVAVCR